MYGKRIELADGGCMSTLPANRVCPSNILPDFTISRWFSLLWNALIIHYPLNVDTQKSGFYTGFLPGGDGDGENTINGNIMTVCIARPD